MGAPAVSHGRRVAAKRPASARAAAASRAAAPAAPARRRPPARRASARTGTRGSAATGTGNVVMLPIAAVGRTAVAVGGLADSGLVVGVSRSRAWIVLVGVLLGGIVALNVFGLSLSSAGSGTAAKIDALERHNSVLRARIAKRTSNARIEQAAAGLGLAIPAPDAIDYLDSSRADAKAAAERLAAGAITSAPAVEEAPVAEDAVAEPIVDPAVAESTTVVEPAPVVTDPAAASATDPATGLALP